MAANCTGVVGWSHLAYAPPAMKKAQPMSHRNRRKTARLRAKLKAKHRRARLRKSRGEKKYP